MSYAVRKETSSTVSEGYFATQLWTVAHPALIGPANVSFIYAPTPESALVDFRKLASQWKEETVDMSSITDIITHPAHLKIVGMGREVLPFIFDELRKEPYHWFVALRSITKDDPVLPQQAGNIDQMTQAWLDWAERNEM